MGDPRRSRRRLRERSGCGDRRGSDGFDGCDARRLRRPLGLRDRRSRRLRGAGVRGYWDRLRVSQVVTNLLSNAVKYGRERPVDVRVRRGEGRAVLEVEDRGIGVAAEDQERIFGRFERAVSARHFAGLGLGLWIVRQLVEAHGGTIRVKSVPGEGATFTVALPG